MKRTPTPSSSPEIPNGAKDKILDFIIYAVIFTFCLVLIWVAVVHKNTIFWVFVDKINPVNL